MVLALEMGCDGGSSVPEQTTAWAISIMAGKFIVSVRPVIARAARAGTLGENCPFPSVPGNRDAPLLNQSYRTEAEAFSDASSRGVIETTVY